jgi:hypothetical protein
MKYSPDETKTGYLLFFENYKELIEICINENPDKTPANETYNNGLINMIETVEKNKYTFTQKQYQWILSKIQFVFKKNKKLRNLISLNSPVRITGFSMDLKK